MDTVKKINDIGDFEKRLSQVEQQLACVLARNECVESDKAWEISSFRISLLSAVTYLTCALVFWGIGVKLFLLNALIPTVGYFLSTQTVPYAKDWWVSQQANYRKGSG